MEYFAVGLAVVGAAAGLAFRWKVLLPIIIPLPLGAIIFAMARGLNYGETAFVLIGSQAILQVGYFAGLLIRFVTAAAMLLIGNWAVKSRHDPKAHGNE